MSLRETVYSIIFDDSQEPTEYLITRRVKDGSDYWQFVGGGKEEGESNRETIEREIEEELKRDDFEIIAELPFTSEGYKFQNDKYIKKVNFFLARLDSSKPVELDEDHPEYNWGTTDEIKEMLSYRQQKKDFLKAVEFFEESVD